MTVPLPRYRETDASKNIDMLPATQWTCRPAMNGKASWRVFLLHASHSDLCGGIGLEDDVVLDSAGRWTLDAACDLLPRHPERGEDQDSGGREELPPRPCLPLKTRTFVCWVWWAPWDGGEHAAGLRLGGGDPARQFVENARRKTTDGCAGLWRQRLPVGAETKEGPKTWNFSICA